MFLILGSYHVLDGEEKKKERIEKLKSTEVCIFGLNDKFTIRYMGKDKELCWKILKAVEDFEMHHIEVRALFQEGS